MDILVATLENRDGFLRYKTVVAIEKLRRDAPALAMKTEPVEALLLKESLRYLDYLSLHYNLFVRGGGWAAVWQGHIALTLLVFAWIGIFGAFAGILLAPDPGGTGFLLGVVICAVGADTVAYFAGRAIGRTPLLPNVSPNKTVEGLVAGAVAAIVLGGIVGAALHPWADKGIGAGLALGLVVAITAPLGDLAESLIKRDLGLKDLGSFLPGHGGFLDRFDAILFTLPAAFYWAVHLFT